MGGPTHYKSFKMTKQRVDLPTPEQIEIALYHPHHGKRRNYSSSTSRYERPFIGSRQRVFSPVRLPPQNPTADRTPLMGTILSRQGLSAQHAGPENGHELQ